MDTNLSSLPRAVGGVVIGARHARMARNGQDACVVSITPEGIAIAVVADGCGSGASSEVGARLGARVLADAVRAQLERGAGVLDAATWERAREATLAAIAPLAHAIDTRDYFLFTLVAAAVTPEGAAIWALGDGAYAIDDAVTTLGPFADNAPPYLAYDLDGDRRRAHFAPIARTSARRIAIATDGAVEAELDLAAIAHDPAMFANADALRRRLALGARADERIDWEARRVERRPAAIQDDCAMAVLAW